MDVYIDGSKIDFPNSTAVGGWSFIVVEDDKILHKDYGKLRIGSQTSARAELEGLYQALIWIKKTNVKATIHTDYNTLVKCMNGESFRKSNRDFWDSIEEITLSLIGKLDVKHIKGHQGHEYNELADKLAKKGANSLLIAPVEN